MTSHFKLLNTKINKTYDVGNGLGQTKMCGSVKPPLSVRVDSSWSKWGTRCVTLGNNPVINHKKKEGRNCDHGNWNIYVVICVIDSPYGLSLTQIFCRQQRDLLLSCAVQFLYTN